jgi:glycine cleavage system H lipoate-binding protein
MSILFVLLTFLLILTVMYFRRPQESSDALSVAPSKRLAAPMVPQACFEVPQGYCFHPGHTWASDEGRQEARVGIDSFAANLFGKIDAIELADLNRWVRQGQKLCRVKREGQGLDLLSPVEGVLVSVNHEVLKNPNLVVEDPYQSGWLCVIKAPELAINAKNLLQGNVIAAWMQNSIARLGAKLQELAPALAQDGGLPIKGLLFQMDANARQQVVKEFFLT